jgi:DNA-binding transcriptional LysR family regulator
VNGILAAAELVRQGLGVTIVPKSLTPLFSDRPRARRQRTAGDPKGRQTEHRHGRQEFKGEAPTVARTGQRWRGCCVR